MDFNKTMTLSDFPLGARPYSKQFLNKTWRLNKTQPRFMNTISHPRELEQLSSNSKFFNDPKPRFLNTISHPRELELLSANSRIPSFDQDSTSVKPKRLNNKRNRKPFKEYETGDGTRKKQKTRARRKNSRSPQNHRAKAWEYRYSRDDFQRHTESTDANTRLQQQFAQNCGEYSLFDNQNKEYPPPGEWGLQQSTAKPDLSEPNCEKYDKVLGILHAKMDPEQKPECAFCKRNNAKDFHHLLKDSTGGVVCPVLSAFTCKMCAATGRNAHTHKYCPVNPITKGDPVAAGMPPGRPLTKSDKQWLKYFHARFILDLYFRNVGGLPLAKQYTQYNDPGLQESHNVYEYREEIGFNSSHPSQPEYKY